MEDSTHNTKLLVDLFDYVGHMVRLTEKAVFTLDQYKQLLYLEHQLKGRIAVHHDLCDEYGPIWLKVERLRRWEPPEANEQVKQWVTVSRDPNKEPVVKKERMETMPEKKAQALVDKGIIAQEYVLNPLKEYESAPKQVDVIWRLKNSPEVKTAIDTYLSEKWLPWSEEEKNRRATIEIYDRFFSLHQVIESQAGEQAVELVWGIGLARWKTDKGTINHPLVEILVEAEINSSDGSITIRPRNVQVQIALRAFFAIENPGADRLFRFSKDFFAALPEDIDFSPYEAKSYEPVLRQAAAQLSTSANYYPDIAEDKDDRTPPDISDQLIVTDTWAIYARPRSDSFLVQDVEKLKDAAKKAASEKIPKPIRTFVTTPSDEPPSFPAVVTGFGSPESSSDDSGYSTHDNSKHSEDLFFPKPFNEAQIEIIRRLEQFDGVVVQGPPGTGKTHTIANIICHYLATGRTVLVTSKGEAALTVLQDHIPEDIRQLTISLLTNERMGLRQLEKAVEILSGVVTRENPHELAKKAEAKKVYVEQVRKKISAIEREIKSWAYKQLSLIDNDLIAGGDKITANQLAEIVLSGKSEHSWLPDKLGPESKFKPQFSDSDIAGLRDARRSLGLDLQYLGCVLSSPADLPDSANIAAIHQDIVTAKQMEQKSHEENIPPLAVSVSNVLERAGKLKERINELIKHNQELGDAVWLKEISLIWQKEGIVAEETLLFGELVVKLDGLVNERAIFIKRPVDIPELGEHKVAVSEAVKKAAKGERPFGILSFGKGDAKNTFAKIMVDGHAPSSDEEWQHVAKNLKLIEDVSIFVAKWNSIGEEYKLPQLDSSDGSVLRTLSELLKLIEKTSEFAVNTVPYIKNEIRELIPYGVEPDAVIEHEEKAVYVVKIINDNISHIRLSSRRALLEDLLLKLSACSGAIVEKMKSFCKSTVGSVDVKATQINDEWSDLLNELKGVHKLSPELNTVARVTDLIESSGATEWANILRTSPFEAIDDSWTPSYWSESWRWRRQEGYIKSIDGRNELKKLSDKRIELDKDLKRAFLDLIKLKTYLGLHRNMSNRVRSALSLFTKALTKIGKGTGVRARRYRGDARNAMKQCYAAVPCWIMPTWRVSESLPAVFGSFDLVIIDEASQSDITALPALARGNKLLIVGDDKQVSPTPPFIQEDKILQLKHNYLHGQPFASAMLPGDSLYDLANAVFPGSRVMLQEHFRCVEPIIKFSYQFYSDPIIALRIPKKSERLDPPLIDVYVPHGERAGKDKINPGEAEAIVDEIQKIVSEPSYSDRSIGVISLIGGKQAKIIQGMLLNAIGEEVYQKFKIECGDSALFQGKEKDIIFLSMIADSSNTRAITGRMYEQRYNVALSRARDRMYLYRSITEDALKENDLKAKVLAHFKHPMGQEENRTEELIELCESGFEREFFRRLTKLDYRIIPQVKVGPFSIDLVVEGADDRRLAIELDGDQYHPPEQWMDDFSRQRTLERVGWRFWRCWGSSFTLNPEECMEDLIDTLDSLGIKPLGETDFKTIYTEYREFHPKEDYEIESIDTCSDEEVGENVEKSI